MDWIDATARLGFPIMSAIALAWAFNAFIHRREKEAADREAALIATLIKEREFKDSKLVELVVGYAKIADESIELLNRSVRVIEDALKKRAGRHGEES